MLGGLRNYAGVPFTGILTKVSQKKGDSMYLPQKPWAHAHVTPRTGSARVHFRLWPR